MGHDGAEKKTKLLTTTTSRLEQVRRYMEWYCFSMGHDGTGKLEKNTKLLTTTTSRLEQVHGTKIQMMAYSSKRAGKISIYHLLQDVAN